MRVRSPEAQQREKERKRLYEQRRVRPARTCAACGRQYHPTSGKQKACTTRCAHQLRPTTRVVWPACKVYFPECVTCGRRYTARSSRGRACSTECQAAALQRYYQENREQYIARAQQRHALVKGLEREDVDPLRIYERDKWTCQLCGKKVRRTPRGKHDPLMASLDHIIPVTKGGGWTYANLHCAHLRCNKSKGNRGGGEQLRLVG